MSFDLGLARDLMELLGRGVGRGLGWEVIMYLCYFVLDDLLYGLVDLRLYSFDTTATCETANSWFI